MFLFFGSAYYLRLIAVTAADGKRLVMRRRRLGSRRLDSVAAASAATATAIPEDLTHVYYYYVGGGGHKEGEEVGFSFSFRSSFVFPFSLFSSIPSLEPPVFC